MAVSSLFGSKASAADLNPSLSALFSSSSGPVLAPEKRSAQKPARASRKQSSSSAKRLKEPAEQDDEQNDVSDNSMSEEDGAGAGDDEELSELDSDAGIDIDNDEDVRKIVEAAKDDSDESDHMTQKSKKRKRKQQDEDLEGNYLNKLAREEEKEMAKLRAERDAKRQRVSATGSDAIPVADGEDDSASDEDDDEAATSPPPLHETQKTAPDENDLEKASRTCFLANVSIEAMTSKSSKKTLLAHLASFLQLLPESKPPHKVESIRFRSTAYSTPIPRKAAFARKEIMEATTHSTNAYVVYTTKAAALAASQHLNGSVILGRHLRVDSVAHPAQIDNRRCVFVGNLGFVDDETNINENSEQKRKKAIKSDVEEGLWQTFSKVGKVESVRVVRDSKTRLGIGIAYVQFVDENDVEEALLYNDKKFPPLLPRKLRVARAKKFKKAELREKADERAKEAGRGKLKRTQNGNGKTDDDATRLGRAKKLFGKAAAAQNGPASRLSANGKPFMKPEAFVFEGHRATSSQGNRGLKLGKSSSKKKGKPQNRGTRRATAWRAKGKAEK